MQNLNDSLIRNPEFAFPGWASDLRDCRWVIEVAEGQRRWISGRNVSGERQRRPMRPFWQQRISLEQGRRGACVRLLEIACR